MFCCSCTQQTGPTGNSDPGIRYTDDQELTEILRRLDEYNNSGNYTQFMNEAKLVYRYAQEIDDTKGMLLLGAGIAYMYVRMDKGDSATLYLDRLIPIAEQKNDHHSLLTLYNTYALYSLYYSFNYDDTMDYLMKAMEITDQDEDNTNYLRLINNISYIYNLRKDTVGLQYSVQVYNAGIQSHDEHLIYLGAANTAVQYCIRKEWNTAHTYIRQAIDLVDKFYSKADIYSIYADILAHIGEHDQADLYFQKAIEIKDDTEAVIICGLYNNYGDFLLNTGRIDEAIEAYNHAIKIALDTKSYMYRHELYLGLSKAYASKGDIQGELEHFKTYHFLSDSLFNTEKERVINDMRVKYETEKMQRRLHTSYLIIGTLIIAIFAVVAFFLHKRRLDKEMISRYYENFRLEQSKKKSMKEDESVELFRRIEDLMNEKKIWKESDISIETVAQYLNSNRSYISNAINQCAGVPFRQYINAFRISEAVAILSDADNDMPLKMMYAELGFNSTSSFYRAFQAATGVPPSKYRKEIHNIKNEKGDSD